jgi:hypothetical protein
LTETQCLDTVARVSHPGRDPEDGSRPRPWIVVVVMVAAAVLVALIVVLHVTGAIGPGAHPGGTP